MARAVDTDATADVAPRRRPRMACRATAGAVTLRGRRECGQARDDREDRCGMIANIHFMFEYSFVTSLISLLARASELPRRGAAWQHCCSCKLGPVPRLTPLLSERTAAPHDGC